MTKPAKLLTQLLQSHERSVSFADFERLLMALGFVHKRTGGSHRHYRHPDVPFVFTINPDGKHAYRYQLRRLLELVEEFGLHIAS